MDKEDIQQDRAQEAFKVASLRIEHLLVHQVPQEWIANAFPGAFIKRHNEEHDKVSGLHHEHGPEWPSS